MNNLDYQFTNNWFASAAKTNWDQLIPSINPKKILEIGSYEGASTCYLINALNGSENTEIHCVDTWEGGLEHQDGGLAPADMNAVENRFIHNTKIALSTNKNLSLKIYKGSSDLILSNLIASGRKNYFDFIYVDGSHLASDVLCDAVLAFKLLKIGGLMVFDDYLWKNGSDILLSPKIAIDAFTNIYSSKLSIISAPLYQLYCQKTSD